MQWWWVSVKLAVGVVLTVLAFSPDVSVFKPWDALAVGALG